MIRALKIGTDGTVEALEVHPKWDSFAHKIGCEYIEQVSIMNPKYKMTGKPYVMLVDEEGLMKEDFVLNPVASFLYDTMKHGNPIVGNVLVVGVGPARLGGRYTDHGDESFTAMAKMLGDLNERLKTSGLYHKLQKRIV